MKKIYLSLAFLLCFVFCSKDPISETSKVAQIQQETSGKISSEALPQTTRSYISDTYPNDVIVQARKTKGSRNYIVSLRTPSVVNVEAEKKRYFNTSGALIKDSSYAKTHLYEGLLECFEYVYPISFTIASDSFEVSSRKELYDTLIEWYRDNPDSNARPKLSYPVNVIDEDGEQKTIENRDELNDAFEDCYYGFYDWYYQACYKIKYPVSYVMPDDSVITGEDRKDLNEKIDQWYDDNPDTLVAPKLRYPITIEEEDGTTTTVEDKKELKELFDECRKRGPSWEWQWGSWGWPGYYEWYWGRCFRFSYPIQYEMPDETILTVDSKEDAWRQFKNWYNDHPNEKVRPKLVFPLTIINKDDDSVRITNRDELRDQYRDCIDEIDDWNWDWSWNWDWGYEGWCWNWGKCYTIDYPITYTLPDDSKVTGNNRSEILQQFKDWYDDHPNEKDHPPLDYPITITKEDGTKVEIKNEDEHEKLYLSCYDDWEKNWKNWADAWKDWDDDWKDWDDAWEDWWDDWKDWWDDNGPWWGNSDDDDDDDNDDDD